MGLLKSLVNLGVAYAQHVTTVRNALKLPEAESATALSSYVKGLSDASFVGFKLSISGMAGKETDQARKQRLNWVVKNADALRQGQAEIASTQEQARLKPQAAISLEDTYKLIDIWFEVPQHQSRILLHGTLAEMNESQRQQFVGHLHTAIEHSRKYLQHLKDNEDKAWGGSMEDRLNYGFARLSTGTSDPAYTQKIERAQNGVRYAEWLAAEAASWKPPAPKQLTQPQLKPQRSTPAASAPAQAASASHDDINRINARIVQKVQASEFDDELFALFEESLKLYLADGLVSPEREFALRKWLDECRNVIDAKRSKQLSRDEVIAEFQRIWARRQELISTAGHHLVADNPDSCARARALLSHLQAIKIGVSGDVLAAGGEKTYLAKMQLARRASNAVSHLKTLKDDAAVIAFEQTEVRDLALAAREISMLPHLTVARPLWDCPHLSVSPNGVFFSGADDARSLLSGVCKQKRLKLGAQVQAQNYGQSRWDALRSNAIAVFDWRRYETNLFQRDSAAALELAAVAYEQGLSIALGTPAVVLAKVGQPLPFDLDTEPLLLGGRDKKEDQAALESALDTVLYSRQRSAARSGLKATADWLRTSLAEHPQHRFFESMGWLNPEHAADPLAFRAAVNQLLTYWGEDSPVALFPSWRAAYPAANAQAGKRLFHIMPFTQPWSSKVMEVAKRMCQNAGVIYERGDTSADVRIMRRVWEGICSADFVLVDITGVSPNVMMELGMAHALGRNTLLVERTQEAIGKVRNLEKIEIASYPTHDQLRTLISKWLNAPDHL